MASPFWLSWIGVLGLSLVGASLIAAQLWSRHRLWRGAAALLGIAMLGLTLSNALMLWPRLHQGIVIAAATPVRVSPVPMGDPLFSLPEGEKVKITAEHDGFALIETRVGPHGLDFGLEYCADRAALALGSREALIFRASSSHRQSAPSGPALGSPGCFGSFVDESSDFRSGPRPSLGFVMPSSRRFFFGAARDASVILSGMAFLHRVTG